MFCGRELKRGFKPQGFAEFTLHAPGIYREGDILRDSALEQTQDHTFGVLPRKDEEFWSAYAARTQYIDRLGAVEERSKFKHNDQVECSTATLPLDFGKTLCGVYLRGDIGKQRCRHLAHQGIGTDNKNSFHRCLNKSKSRRFPEKCAKNKNSLKKVEWNVVCILKMTIFAVRNYVKTDITLRLNVRNSRNCRSAIQG